MEFIDLEKAHDRVFGTWGNVWKLKESWFSRIIKAYVLNWYNSVHFENSIKLRFAQILLVVDALSTEIQDNVTWCKVFAEGSGLEDNVEF